MDSAKRGCVNVKQEEALPQDGQWGKEERSQRRSGGRAKTS